MASGGANRNNPLDTASFCLNLWPMNATEFKSVQSHMGVSGTQLAAWLKTTPETVSRWRSGVRPIPGSVALAIKALSEGYRP